MKKSLDIKFPSDIVPETVEEKKKEFKPEEDLNEAGKIRWSVRSKYEAEVRLKELEDYYKSFYGQEGHNPWYKLQDLQVLINRFNNEERTIALYEAISSFPKEPPIV